LFLLSAVSSEREEQTPASAKRQRTPCGRAEATTPPPPTHGNVSATATGTEEPGATAPTFTPAASPAAAASVAADAAHGSTPPLESPQEGAGLLGEASAATAGLLAATAPSPVPQLQLSYFTDLFGKDGNAVVATDAATTAAAPVPTATAQRSLPPSRRRGRSAGTVPMREAMPTPLRMAAVSPLVSSPLMQRAAEPWRATRHALQAAMVG